MKTVLITGVSRGIGKALAQKFLSEGWRALGTSTSGEVDYENENLKVFQLDLSSPESIAQCAEKISEGATSLDILINNAGILADEDETVVDIKRLRKTLEVNLIGTIDFCERTRPLVKAGGHVIFTSSSAGSLGLVGKQTHYLGHYPAYKISKAAINMYMRTLANKLQNSHIVSSVHPGWVRTDMGGVDEADITPEQAAEEIYNFAVTSPETGGFWFNGERMPW